MNIRLEQEMFTTQMAQFDYEVETKRIIVMMVERRQILVLGLFFCSYIRTTPPGPLRLGPIRYGFRPRAIFSNVPNYEAYGHSLDGYKREAVNRMPRFAKPKAKGKSA